MPKVKVGNTEIEYPDVRDANEGWEDIPENNNPWEDIPQTDDRGLIRKGWDLINKPLPEYLPDKERSLVRKGLGYNPIFDTALDYAGVSPERIRGLETAKEDVGESLLSPLSIGTMGTAGLLAKAPLLAKGISGLFAGQGLYGAVKSGVEAYNAKDPEEQTRALAETGANLAFGGLAGLHATHPGKSSVVEDIKNAGPRLLENAKGSEGELPPLQSPIITPFNNELNTIYKQEQIADRPTQARLGPGNGGVFNRPDVTYEYNIKRPTQAEPKIIDVDSKVTPITDTKLGPAETPTSGELIRPFTKPSDTSNLRQLPIRYQEQFPKQSMYGVQGNLEKGSENVNPNLERMASEVGNRQQELEQAKSIENAGREAVETGRVVQTPSEIVKSPVETSLKTSAEKAVEGGTLYANPIGALFDAAARGVGKVFLSAEKIDPTRPQIDKVAEKGPTGKYAAPKLENFYDALREYRGKLINSLETKLFSYLPEFKDYLTSPLKFLKERLTLNSPEINRAWQYLNDIQDNKTSAIKLTPREQEIVKAIKQNLLDSAAIQQTKNIPVWDAKGPRAKNIDPDYVPHIMSLDTYDTLSNKQGTSEFAKVKKLMTDYWINKKGISPKFAEAHFDDIVRSFKASDESNKGSQFGPIDKAAGLGLPTELREQNPIHAMHRFNERAARRFSYFDAIENDPHMRSALGINSDVWGNPTPKGLKLPTGEDVQYIGSNEDVAPIMRDIESKRSIKDLKIDAGSTALKALVMQAWSGIRDFLSTNVLGWQHQLPTQYAKSILKGWSNASRGIAEGLAKGVIRQDTTSFEGIEGGVGDVITNLQRVRAAAGFVSLRNAFEKLTRGVTFEQGKYLAIDNAYRLATKPGGIGSEQRVKFMNDFAKDINWKGKASLTPEEVGTIAARYTESVQGTYDYRGLPRATQEGVGSYIMSWNRWNVEKKNNFMKYVVKPLAEDGNYWPLVGAAAGTIVGGTAVQQLRQIISGDRKEKSPTWKEISDKNNKRTLESLFYKMASLADASGQAGIAASIAHNLMRYRFGDQPQAMFDYPLVQSVKDNTKLVLQAIEAMEAGETDVGINFLSRFIEANVQNARLAIDNLSEKKQEDIKHSNKVRDYSMFRELQGEHTPVSSMDINPFLGQKEKDFKRSTDLNKIPDQAISAVNDIVNKSKDDPIRLASQLRGLKSTPITWMPSVEGNPMEFMKYVDFVKKTQGKEAAQKLVSDYATQKAVNQAKSQVVPNLRVR